MKHKVWGLLLGMMAVMASGAGHAENLLGIAPMRVLLNDVKTNEMISLTNRSDRVRTYKVSMLDQVMDASGSMGLKDDFAYSAKRMLRFMPRQITLKPGEHQSLRVMVMPPESLAEGEYHTHLIFDEVLPQQSKDAPPPEPGFRVKLESQYSIGIPLIYQHGKVTSSMALTGASLKMDKHNRPAFLINLARTGNGEAYCLLKVVEKGGNGQSLILPRKVYMYREVDQINLLESLNDKETATLQALQNKKLQAQIEQEGAAPQVIDVTH